MAKKHSSPRQPATPSNIEPTLTRQAGSLLNKFAALERGADQQDAEGPRERLREQVGSIGLRLVSITVTEDLIPDPAIEALPAMYLIGLLPSRSKLAVAMIERSHRCD